VRLSGTRWLRQVGKSGPVGRGGRDMKAEVGIIGITALWLSSAAFAQRSIPAGTVLPVQLNSTLNSGKNKPGDRITARIMQDVPLSPGRKIHAGAKVVGQVLRVQAAGPGQAGEITLRFDRIASKHPPMVGITSLRALASMMEVEAVQIPPAGTDRGTPWAWSTRNLIGGEVAYGQGGPVVHGADEIGQSLFEGVLVPAQASTDRHCRGEVGGNDRLQAFWVFASDACGVYGMDDVEIAHAGRTPPVGEITLTSKTGNVEISGGSGMLLRVNEGHP
jgi:hypothetical protein